MSNSAKVFYQEDCDLTLLYGKTIAVIGYGSQGHAHALNAKESLGDNARVIIGLYEGSRSWAKAEAQGFEVFTAAEAAKQADIIMILINDEKQAAMYKQDIEPNLKEGDMLMFAHGFAIHFGQIVPPSFVDVTMIAPKGPGHTVRSEYQAGKGVSHTVLQSAAQERAFLRQLSEQKQKQIFSANRQFFAAAYALLCRRALKLLLKRDMIRETLISSVFMK